MKVCSWLYHMHTCRAFHHDVMMRWPLDHGMFQHHDNLCNLMNVVWHLPNVLHRTCLCLWHISFMPRKSPCQGLGTQGWRNHSHRLRADTGTQRIQGWYHWGWSGGGGNETLYGAPGGHPATHGCGGQRTSEFFQGTGQPLPFSWPLLMGSGTPGSRCYTLESRGHRPLILSRHFSTMHSPLVILLTLMWGPLVFTQKQGKATATLCVTMKAWLGPGLDLGRVPSCVHTLHTVCKHRALWRMLSASGLELLIWIHCSKYNLRLCWASLSTL